MNHNINNLPTGWKFESTPSHGYLHIPSHLLKQMPGYLAKLHPFEEDCAINIPFAFFSDLFDEKTINHAEQSVKNWYWQEWEKWKGVEIAKGESQLKDKLLYLCENAGKYAVFSASGDWHEKVPTGYVGVYAQILNEKGEQTGDEKQFLVKKEKYRSRQFTYIIQEDDIEINWNL